MSKRVLFILMTSGMILLIIVSAISASFYIKNQLTNKLIDQYALQQGVLAKQVSQSLQVEVSALREQLVLISEYPEIKNGSAAECNKKMLEIYKAGGVKIGNLGRVGSDGVFRCSINTKLIGKKAATLGPYIDDIFNDPTHAPVMSRAIKPPGATSYLIAIHVPVWGPKHEFLGTLGGAIYLSDLQAKFLTNTPFVTGSTMALYDDDGTILYNPKTDFIGSNLRSPEFQALLKNAIPPEQVIADIKNGVSGTRRYSFDNQERVVAFVPVEIFPNRRWRIGVIVPISSIYAEQQTLGVQGLIEKFALGILLLVTLIGGFFLWIMVKKIFDPINDLAKSAEKIGSGDFTTSVLIHEGSDEIGRLGKVFNTMIAKLKAANELLEEKVRVRTKELSDITTKDEAILASLGEGVAVADPTGKLIYWNNAAEQILGMSLSAKHTEEWAEHFGVFYEDEKTVMPGEKQALALALGGENIESMPEFIRNAGLPQGRHISVTARPIANPDGTSFGAVAIFRDVTKEYAIDRAKNEFVSLASHQLRTPLTSIRWYTELLLDEETKKLAPDQREYAKQIQEAMIRMNGLVASLLDVSRLDLGTFIIEPKEEDLVEILQCAVDEQKESFKEKKQKFTFKHPAAIPKLPLDAKLLHIIVQNLLSNAYKYSPEGAKITLTLSKKSEGYEITCADTGYGIPKAQQGEIFQKLFRADNIRTLDVEGTGLGLYIIKTIVEAAGCSISFTSEEGKGTTFVVFLPKTGMKEKGGTRTLSGTA